MNLDEHTAKLAADRAARVAARAELVGGPRGITIDDGTSALGALVAIVVRQDPDRGPDDYAGDVIPLVPRFDCLAVADVLRVIADGIEADCAKRHGTR